MWHSFCVLQTLVKTIKTKLCMFISLNTTSISCKRKLVENLKTLRICVLVGGISLLSSLQTYAQVDPSAFFNIPENKEGTIHTVEASEGADISGAIFNIKEGLDGALFSVTSSGRISFKTAPDYESPQDSERDNRYELEVLVIDGTDEYIQSIVFGVLNLSDEAEIISQPVIRVLETDDYYYQIELVEERPVTITASDLPAWLTLTNQGEVEDLIDFFEISTDDQNNPVTLGNAARTAIDEEGNLYINNFESVYKYSRKGVISFIAGSGTGFRDGTGSDAQFGRGVTGMVLDADRNVYISDNFNHSIRKITPDGVMTTIMGDGNAGIGMGTNGLERLDGPNGLDADANGNIYIADGGNDRVVRINSSGALEIVAAGFDSPKAVAVDRDNGNVFVADTENSLIKKVSPEGAITVFAGGGNSHRDNGTSIGTEANFSRVDDMVIDQHKNLYVVSGLSIRKITPEAVMTNLIGKTERASNVNNATSRGVDYVFSSLLDLTVDHLGNLYITDDGLKKASLFNKISGDASDQLGTHSVALTSTADNGETFDQNFNILVSEVDEISPSVVNVTSSNENGSYGYNEIIDILVEFDEVVNVTGTPRLELAHTLDTYQVVYVSGSGSNTLSFTYLIQGGHTTSDQDYSSTEALSILEASITDDAGNNASLTLPVPGETGSLSANKDLRVNATPTVTMSFGPETLTNEASDQVQSLIFELSHPTSQSVRLSLGISGTATTGEDYLLPVAVVDNTIVMEPNVVRAEYAFNITSDDVREIHETIIVDLLGSTHAVFLEPQKAILTIQEKGPPILIQSNPEDEETEFTGSSITFTFSGDIVKGDGRIGIFDSATDMEITGAGAASPRVTVSDNTATLDLLKPLPLEKQVYVRIPKGAFQDTEGLEFRGIQDNTTLNFSTKTRPRLVSSSPADDATEFSGTKITLTFDRDMSRGVGRIAVLDAADDSEISGAGARNERLTIDGNTVTIDLISPLPIDKQLYLKIPSSAFVDDDNIRYRGILDKTTLNFSTPATPKLVSTSPADESVEFEETEITFTFDKAVVAGRGRITIHNAADDEVIIDRGVNGPDVSITENVVTLDLKRSLRGSTDVYIKVSPEAFIGENGLLFNGIDDKETLNFTTGSGPTEVNIGEFDLPISGQSNRRIVRVFPNPAKDHITLDLSVLEGESTLQITSIDGIVKLKKAKITVPQLKVDVSKYADGIYLVKVRSQSGIVAYEKFMVKR